MLEVTAGPVFTALDDGIHRVRASLTWYPNDLWRYVLACDWARLAQDLPLMGRAADVGDERGSRLIAARVAHVMMHLAFNIERRWPPYAKWFGTAFETLQSGPGLGPCIDRLLDGVDRSGRQTSAATALRLLLDLQNDRGLTEVDDATVSFWNRPHIHPAPAIVEQLMEPVRDASIRALPIGSGSIEQQRTTSTS